MDFVADIFADLRPILGGALFDIADVPLATGIRRPADLAALGPMLASRLGEGDARKVAAGTEIEALSRLLPAG